MFSDIDLWIIGRSVTEVFELLKQSDLNVTQLKVIGQKDVETKIYALYKGIRFTIEVKQKNHHSVSYIKNQFHVVDLAGTSVKTFSIKDTFLILMNYFYYYTEDINSMIFDGKSIFQIPLDIFNLIKKYHLKMDLFFMIKRNSTFLFGKIMFLILNYQPFFVMKA